MDFNTLREPFEVWRAALGDFEPLVERLRSGEPIHEIEREAIALLISGKLKPPLRRKAHNFTRLHQSISSTEVKSMHYPEGNWVPVALDQRKRNAAALYRHIMRQLHKSKDAYRRSGEVMRYVAECDGLSLETVRDVVRRAQAKPAIKPEPDAPALTPEQSKALIRDDCLWSFENWCQIHWKDVQQFRARKR